MTKHQLPSSKWLLLLFVILTIVFSLVAGWHHQQYVAERKRYLRLEDMFVRVRSELGREQTQELIDRSYE